MIHKLKTWPVYFKEIWYGYKTFEVRYNDRNFKEGDEVILQEYLPQEKEYTGRKIQATIGFLLEGGQFGIKDGTVVFSLINLDYDE